MALTANQKLRVRKALHRAYSAQELPAPWTKPDADAAITAVDDWLDGIAATYVAALPQPYRASSSAGDKAVLLIVLAIAQRLVSEPAHVAILRQITGELSDIQGA